MLSTIDMTDLTESQRKQVSNRWRDALWYGYGFKDATRATFDAHEFATFAGNQMRDYVKERRTSLAPVQDQMAEWLKARYPLSAEARRANAPKAINTPEEVTAAVIQESKES